MPDIVNLTLTEDDNGTATFQITSEGDPLGLEGATVFAVVKRDQHVEDDDEGAYRLAEGEGVTIVNAEDGTVRVDYPTVVTSSPGSWFHKVRVTSSGSTETAIWGWLSILDA